MDICPAPCLAETPSGLDAAIEAPRAPRSARLLSRADTMKAGPACAVGEALTGLDADVMLEIAYPTVPDARALGVVGLSGPVEGVDRRLEQLPGVLVPGARIEQAVPTRSDTLRWCWPARRRVEIQPLDHPPWRMPLI